jgi:gluconate 2-dehydrogenase gamma chain
VPHYPTGTVRALLSTTLVTPNTREVLEERLNQPVTAPRFFATDAFATLRAVCARLIPQHDHHEPIDLAGAIDQRLAENKTDGWRYDDMPPDADAYTQGLQGLDESARLTFGVAFVDLTSEQQDQMLSMVQRGGAPGEIWKTIPQQRFFEELLAETCECYYSHPIAQEEIGYVGMADANGWQRIGLNELETHEPRADPRHA